MLSQLGPFVAMGQIIMSENNQRCALVNATSNVVENLIIADPTVDPIPSGYLLIGLPENSPVAVGWIYDPSTNTFTDPNPPPPESDPVPDPTPVS